MTPEARNSYTKRDPPLYPILRQRLSRFSSSVGLNLNIRRWNAANISYANEFFPLFLPNSRFYRGYKIACRFFSSDSQRSSGLKFPDFNLSYEFSHLLSQYFRRLISQAGMQKVSAPFLENKRTLLLGWRIKQFEFGRKRSGGRNLFALIRYISREKSRDIYKRVRLGYRGTRFA